MTWDNISLTSECGGRAREQSPDYLNSYQDQADQRLFTPSDQNMSSNPPPEHIRPTSTDPVQAVQ